MNSIMLKNKFIYGGLITAFLLLFTACLQLRETSSDLQVRFPDARIENIVLEGRNIRYMHLHRNDTLPTIFFLHGSPSNMTVYNDYYEDQELAQWANIIAADRPGYGFSGLGQSEKSVVKQARKMWKILEKEDFPSPLYIIGSSYGGTVAAKMAMQKPEKVNGVVLVSASLAPGKETTYFVSHIIKYPPFRWLMPRAVMVANDEKLSHYDALTEILPFWDNITSPVILFQGTGDKLIFPENVDFALDKLVNSPFVEYHMLEGEGHFLQLKYRELILERLTNLISLGKDTLNPLHVSVP
jgi:pimeloyl-ACP methyl ester carboxylesterase